MIDDDEGVLDDDEMLRRIEQNVPKIVARDNALPTAFPKGGVMDWPVWDGGGDDDVEVQKVGNERSGHRGHQGRPGQRGGSLPRGGAPAAAVSSPDAPARETLVLQPTENPLPPGPPVDESGRRLVIPEDQFEEARRAVAQHRAEAPVKRIPPLPQLAQDAMESGLQEFARDVEERLGKGEWKVEGYPYESGFRLNVEGRFYDEQGTTRLEGPARMTLDYRPEYDTPESTHFGSDYILHAAYVKMPDAAQHKGMGPEIVNNVMHTAVKGGFKAVDYDAVSGGALKGGYVWAKMGATFAKPEDRTRMVQKYVQYTAGSRDAAVPDSEFQMMSKTWEPRDFLAAPQGGEFLLTSDAYYSGRFNVR